MPTVPDSFENQTFWFIPFPNQTFWFIPFENRMFLSGFRKFLHSKTGPFVNRFMFNHLKTGHDRDPHCIDHRYRGLGWSKIVQCHLILPRYRVCCSEQDKRVRVCAFDWRPRQIFGRAIIEVLQGWDYIVGVQLLHEGAVLCAVLHYKDL